MKILSNQFEDQYLIPVAHMVDRHRHKTTINKFKNPKQAMTRSERMHSYLLTLWILFHSFSHLNKFATWKPQVHSFVIFLKKNLISKVWTLFSFLIVWLHGLAREN